MNRISKYVMASAMAAFLMTGTASAQTAADKFDYSAWLSPTLSVKDSTAEPRISAKEFHTRILRATVYLSGSNSLGSGVMIDNKRCLAITNDHVAGDMDLIRASYARGTRADGTLITETVAAKIIGNSGDNSKGFDITLIQLASCDGAAWSPIASLNTLKNLSIRDTVFASGNPMGQTWTVTEGIISHPARTGVSGPWPMIQTDASVNPGNSGGPLFNTKGEILGLNTLIISKARENNGLAYATRADLIRLFLNNVYAYGKMVIPAVGISVMPITVDEAIALGLPAERIAQGYTGVNVSETPKANTPAAKAGIQKDDIVISVNGTAVHDPSSLTKAVWSNALDANTFKVLRLQDDGTFEEHTITVTPENSWQPSKAAAKPEAYTGVLGWKLALEASTNLPLVEEVSKLSPAFRANVVTMQRKSDPLAFISVFGIASDEKSAQRTQLSIPREKQTYMVITGAKVEGLAPLYLNRSDRPEDVRAALEAYLAEGVGKKTALFIEYVERTTTTVGSGSTRIETVDIPVMTPNGIMMRRVQRQVTVPSIPQAKIDAIRALYGDAVADELFKETEERRSFVISVQPEAYVAPQTTDTWEVPNFGDIPLPSPRPVE